MAKTRDGREFIVPSDEEDARITAAALADPDGQPMTDEQLDRLRPANFPPAFFEALERAKRRLRDASSASGDASVHAAKPVKAKPAKVRTEAVAAPFPAPA